jgi:Undecaprenyl-phosphate glucose phosphotransferase
MSDCSSLIESEDPRSSVVPQRSPRRRWSRLIPFSALPAVCICLDCLLVIATSLLTGIAYHSFYAIEGFGRIYTFLGVGVLTAALFTALLAARGNYQPHELMNWQRQVRQISTAWLFTFLLLSFVAFYLKTTAFYSRGATLTFFISGWALLGIWRFYINRSLARAMVEGGFAEKRIILIAEQDQLNIPNLANELYRYGYQTVQTYKLSSLSSSAIASMQLSETVTAILEKSRKESIDGLFLLVSWSDIMALELLHERIRPLAIPVYLLPDRNIAHLQRYRFVSAGVGWIAELKRAPLSATERVFKRTLDLMLASLALITLAPLLVLVAASIKLLSRGPVLFMQTRNGFNGRPFRMCKFRTMFVLEDGPIIQQATKDDPRVTWLGRLLRRTNLDELPQLFNVIVGQMSLVGPRPHAAAHNSEYERLIANYAYRYHVKPGITGWAQINGYRGETRTLDLMEKRVELDRWYIENWSYWLDLKIILRTLVLGLQPNAY